MKILFIHANTADYLSACIFHGLRSLLGENCIDVPRFDCMYQPLPTLLRESIRGKAFTLYGLMKDIPSLNDHRCIAWQESNLKVYDYYVIADIWRQWDDYHRLSRLVDRERILVLDPADTPRLFPWNNLIREHKYFRRSLGFLGIKPTRYYKREMASISEGLAALPNMSLKLARFLIPSNIYTISFSIPAEKIMGDITDHRPQLYAKNIVDPDVSRHVDGSFYTPLGKSKYLFESESDYYSDLQKSRFGITTKRSGWDCLRHYEIAANGAVICFKDLDKKPSGCAPHDLNQENCIIYSNYQDLKRQVDNLNGQAYRTLQKNSLEWIKNYTTVAVAQRLIDDLH